MNTKVAVPLIILLVVVIGLLGWYFFSEQDTNTNTSNTTVNTKPRPAENEVWIVDGSFNPAIITVNAGDKITWINKDVIARKVAADPYPSSSTLPEMVSGDLAQGEKWSFTFDTAGTYTYHDGLNPIQKGQIAVE